MCCPHTYRAHLITIVLADTPALTGARPSAGAVLSSELVTVVSSAAVMFLDLWHDLHYFCSYLVTLYSPFLPGEPKRTSSTTRTWRAAFCATGDKSFPTTSHVYSHCPSNTEAVLPLLHHGSRWRAADIRRGLRLQAYGRATDIRIRFALELTACFGLVTHSSPRDWVEDLFFFQIKMVCIFSLYHSKVWCVLNLNIFVDMNINNHWYQWTLSKTLMIFFKSKSSLNFHLWIKCPSSNVWENIVCRIFVDTFEIPHERSYLGIEK